MHINSRQEESEVRISDSLAVTKILPVVQRKGQLSTSLPVCDRNGHLFDIQVDEMKRKAAKDSELEKTFEKLTKLESYLPRIEDSTTKRHRVILPSISENARMEKSIGKNGPKSRGNSEKIGTDEVKLSYQNDTIKGRLKKQFRVNENILNEHRHFIDTPLTYILLSKSQYILNEHRHFIDIFGI